ncbi:MAG: J domain-containing protein [Ilumatobacteraceae bacterium]
MTPGDPFAVLGLPPTATVAEVREARRRLAFELHPDRGGDVVAMQRLNAAFDACLATIERGAVAAAAEAAARPGPSAPQRRRQRQPRPAPRRPHVEHDLPSFTIDALPAEAFEALLVVASWIGEVVDDDPPYVLDCHLHDPVPCWCRLELVPDAGGSTVNLTVASGEAGPVSAELVRDIWVDNLNRLGGPPP